MPREIVEQQAKYLASENRKNDPDISEIYWFPDEAEVRLIEVNSTVPKTADEEVISFYFRPDPKDQLPAPSRIALIRPDEVRRVRVPKSWGDWDQAIRLEGE